MCVPAGSRRDQQQAYFIGGSEELQDLTYVAVPQGHTGKVLNKYGYKTQTSGNVKVGTRGRSSAESRRYMHAHPQITAVPLLQLLACAFKTVRPCSGS